MSQKTPENLSLRDQVYNAVRELAPRSPRAVLSSDEVIFPRVPTVRVDLPRFPLVFVPDAKQKIFVREIPVLGSSSRSNLLTFNLYHMTGKEGLAIEVQSQRAQDSSLVLEPHESQTPGWVQFSPEAIKVGGVTIKEGKPFDNGLMIAMDPEKTWQHPWTWRNYPVYHLRSVLLPPGWEAILKEDRGLTDPKQCQFIRSGQEIADMLRASPALGFAALQDEVGKLPKAGNARTGYFSGHSDNPARVSINGGEIEARFLYVDMPTLAGQVREGRLTPESFLQECLRPGRSEDAPHEVHLRVALNGGGIDASVAIKHFVMEGGKPAWVDSMPLIGRDLAETGIEPGTLRDCLRSNLCNAQGLGRLFASFNSAPEAAAQPEIVIPVISVGDVRLGRGNRVEVEQRVGATDNRSHSDRERQNGRSHSEANTVGQKPGHRRAGSKWQKKHQAEGWIQRNSK